MTGSLHDICGRHSYGFRWWEQMAVSLALLKMPQLVAAACIFIRDKFGMGYRKLPCGVKESENYS